MRFLTGTDPVQRELVDELKKFNEGRTEAKEQLETLKAAANVEDLKRQIVDLEIQRDKKQEDFDRKEREIKHMIGLEKKRSESEKELAKKEVEIEVRNENMKAKEDQFAEQMKFMQERMEKELESMRHLYDMMVSKVPTVTVDRKINENYGEAKAIEAGDATEAS